MDDADRLFRELLNRRLRPSAFVYTSLLQGCSLARRPDRAAHYFDDAMARPGLRMNRKNFCALVKWLRACHESDTAFRAFCESRRELGPGLYEIGTGTSRDGVSNVGSKAKGGSAAAGGGGGGGGAIVVEATRRRSPRLSP